ncbi:MAG: hypothetical protein IPK48_09885 [Gammaproteobacteria bacterium]|nr:hypothetical protein [Gammaproteobacteria bacterium]
MQHGKHLAEQAARDLATSSKNSATAVGPAERPLPDPALIDAINQAFALFRVNYHNQFYSAFADTTLLDQAKRLWLDSLRHVGPGPVLAAARALIEQEEYLPTLRKMLGACEDQLAAQGLPRPRDAYREACNAPRPKDAQRWSHPAVYHAGRILGWYDLATRPESVTWPEFQRAYRDCCRRALAGEDLSIPAPPEPTPTPALSREEGAKRLHELRRQLEP